MSESKYLPPWKTMDSAPMDGTVIDIWSASEGRLASYKRIRLSKNNIFYDPDEQGLACIRDAIAWMPLPEPPKLAINPTEMGAKMAEAYRDANQSEIQTDHFYDPKCSRCGSANGWRICAECAADLSS